MAARFVVYVVHLVHYYGGEFRFDIHLEMEICIRIGILVIVCIRIGAQLQGIVEDFGGHDHQVGGRVGFDISRAQPDADIGEFPGEFVEFLVTQGFYGARVDDFLSLSHEMADSELGRQSFPRPGGSAHQCMVPIHDSLYRVLLERR